jgi:hypothetical protein
MPQLFLFPQLKRGRSLAIWSTAALVDKVNNFLNDTLSDIWSGCGGSAAWPPSSPDLTTPDFFVWGFVKKSECDQRSQETDDLNAMTAAACRHVMPQTFSHTCTLSFPQRGLCLSRNEVYVA